MTGTAEVLDPVKTVKPDDGMEGFLGWRTTLFNCNCHSFEQVIAQLTKAIRCDMKKAKEHAMEVHKTGSSVVYSGCRERCEAVSMVLEDINLKTNVSQ